MGRCRHEVGAIENRDTPDRSGGEGRAGSGGHRARQSAGRRSLRIADLAPDTWRYQGISGCRILSTFAYADVSRFVLAPGRQQNGGTTSAPVTTFLPIGTGIPTKTPGHKE